MRATLLVPALALLGLATCSRTGGGPCDPKLLGELRGALSAVDADMRQALALRGLGEACAARLPPLVGEYLRADVDPSAEASLAARALAETSGFGARACEELEEVFAAAGAAAPADKARVLYDGCAYAKLGLMSLEEYRASAGGRMGAALIGPSLYAWLAAEGMPAPEARVLVRTAMGLER